MNEMFPDNSLALLAEKRTRDHVWRVIVRCPDRFDTTRIHVTLAADRGKSDVFNPDRNVDPDALFGDDGRR